MTPITSAPRTFALIRDRDVSGVSGTGHVADGVQWPDGTVTLRWRGARPSTVQRDCIEHVYDIEGHGGATRIVWTSPALTTALELEAIAERFAVESTRARASVERGWVSRTWDEAIGILSDHADKLREDKAR